VQNAGGDRSGRARGVIRLGQTVRSQKQWPGFKGGRVRNATLTAAVGLILLILPLGEGLTSLSYDLPFFFRSDIPVNEAVILYMDEASEERLGQGRWDRWDRSIHANLLDNLARAGPKLVVFDVLFWPRGANIVSNTNLVRAAQDFGHVAVAAMVTPRIHDGRAIGSDLSRPFEELAAVAAWGVVEVGDENRAVREHYRDEVFRVPSLAWRAAELAQGKPPPDPFARRWVNYYGPPGFIRYLSYADVLATNFTSWPVLSNKVVFVGALWNVGFTGGKGTDDFRTPYTRWTGRRSPGVEIIATTSLNLMRGDWLKRLPPVAECLVMVLTGALLGLGLTMQRPLAATGWGVLVSLLVAATAMFLVWPTRVWFPWMIVVVAQVPCAVGWSLLVHTQRLVLEKKLLEHRLVIAGEAPGIPRKPEGLKVAMAQVSGRAPDVEAHAVSPSAAVTRVGAPEVVTPPVVPDHQLLLRIGQGAYGEVWLARDILGTFHAAKIVYRRNFGDAAPFEREFNGLKRFTPVSRAHPGLVNILHVGRHPDPDYIYYVMEPADDEMRGQDIDPKNYSPKTLAKELRKRKRLPLAECLQLSVDLAAALEFLHQHHLIHRDVKPSNIIFVRGAPKLADIGLVTEIADRASEVSYVGTRGYIPPEGPGTPAADVYSLGKVIYEAAMGMQCSNFPQLPATLLDQTEEPELLELNQIILRACENNPDKRIQSAAELQAALAELLRRTH
jgi:CHASE2 domain-containing sensor protein